MIYSSIPNDCIANILKTNAIGLGGPGWSTSWVLSTRFAVQVAKATILLAVPIVVTAATYEVLITGNGIAMLVYQSLPATSPGPAWITLPALEGSLIGRGFTINLYHSGTVTVAGNVSLYVNGFIHPD